MSNQTISLQLDPRAVSGKAVKKLRKEGFVPAVVYKDGKPGENVQAKYELIAKVYTMAGRNHPINLQVGDKKQLAMIKDVDLDPVKHRIRHIAFHAIKQNEKVTAEVPIEMKLNEGNEQTPAERTGLVVLTALDAVEVKALPAKLPEALYFDGEKLATLEDRATLADLVIPEGVELEVDDLTQLVASVYEPSALAAANDEAGGSATDESEVASENGGNETAAEETPAEESK